MSPDEVIDFMATSEVMPNIREIWCSTEGRQSIQRSGACIVEVNNDFRPAVGEAVNLREGEKYTPGTIEAWQHSERREGYCNVVVRT